MDVKSPPLLLDSNSSLAAPNAEPKSDVEIIDHSDKQQNHSHETLTPIPNHKLPKPDQHNHPTPSTGSPTQQDSAVRQQETEPDHQFAPRQSNDTEPDVQLDAQLDRQADEPQPNDESNSQVDNPSPEDTSDIQLGNQPSSQDVSVHDTQAMSTDTQPPPTDSPQVDETDRVPTEVSLEAERPATPVAEQPATPVAEQPATPVAEQPATPVAESSVEAVAVEPPMEAAVEPDVNSKLLDSRLDESALGNKERVEAQEKGVVSENKTEEADGSNEAVLQSKEELNTVEVPAEKEEEKHSVSNAELESVQGDVLVRPMAVEEESKMDSKHETNESQPQGVAADVIVEENRPETKQSSAEVSSDQKAEEGVAVTGVLDPQSEQSPVETESASDLAVDKIELPEFQVTASSTVESEILPVEEVGSGSGNIITQNDGEVAEGDQDSPVLEVISVINDSSPAEERTSEIEPAAVEQLVVTQQSEQQQLSSGEVERGEEDAAETIFRAGAGEKEGSISLPSESLVSLRSESGVHRHQKKKKHHKPRREVFESIPAPSRADASYSKVAISSPRTQSVFQSTPQVVKCDAATAAAPSPRSQQKNLYEKEALPSHADATATSALTSSQKQSVFQNAVNPSKADARAGDSALDERPAPAGVYESPGKPSGATVRAVDPVVLTANADAHDQNHCYSNVPAASTAHARAAEPRQDQTSTIGDSSTVYASRPEPSNAHVTWNQELQPKTERTVFESVPEVQVQPSARWDQSCDKSKDAPTVFQNQPMPSIADASAAQDASDAYSETSSSESSDAESSGISETTLQHHHKEIEEAMQSSAYY